MKYLQTYKIFEYNSENLYIKVFDKESYAKEIYNNEGNLKDPTYYDRIRYSNISDLSWSSSDLKLMFIVLYLNDKIIGVCKIGNWDKNVPNKRSISYCSIDREYRGKKYLKYIVQKLMEVCKENNFILTASRWTVPGYLILRKSLIKYSKMYGVEFIDHNNMHDAPSMYNKDLISRYEMTDDERKKHDQGDVYDKDLNESKGDGTKEGINILNNYIKDVYKWKEESEKDKNIIDENVSDEKTPEWFYLVLRDSRSGRNPGNQNVWKSLSTGKFKGLRGISDNPLISRAWFDVRPIMIVMPANKVLELNKGMEGIEYFNPDQLVRNNFEYLKRVFDNEKIVNQDEEYSITSTITKMFQNMSLIGRYNVIGSKKKSRIFGTWTREPSKKYLGGIIYSTNHPSFYYGIGKYIYKQIKKGRNIMNVHNIAEMIGEYIDQNRDNMTKKEYSYGNPLSSLVEEYDKNGIKNIEKVLMWCLNVTGKVYSKHEGEWIVPKNSTFKVPDGSYLFIKETPNYYKDIKGYEQWIKDVRSQENSTLESQGIPKEEIKQLVSQYNLESKYDVRRVNHSYELLDILKKDFNNYVKESNHYTNVGLKSVGDKNRIKKIDK